MVVGDRKTEEVCFGEGKPKTMTGTVVYIHPARRFYVVEFETETGTFRESFYFPNRRGDK